MRACVSSVLIAVLAAGLCGCVERAGAPGEAAGPRTASVATNEDVDLDLAPLANMGFADDVAGDGVGGWSDQGPERDFRGMDLGASSFLGCPLRIIDPACNNGRAVLSFASPRNSPKITLREAIVPVPLSAPPARFLYLLHTTCWSSRKAGEKVGTVKAVFSDGTEVEREIKEETDVGDWWQPCDLPNGAVAFSYDNGTNDVGLYFSRIPLADTPRTVKEIRLVTADAAVWIVVAATLSSREFEMTRPPLTIMASDEWKAIDMSSLGVKKGSILDLSALHDWAPVGSRGRVIVGKDGHFTFEKDSGRRVKFLGCSIVEEALEGLSTKEKAEAFADLVRRQGYNIVRLRGLDHYLLKDAKEDGVFNPVALDRFDYLLHCLRQRGVYLYLDAMTSWGDYAKGNGGGEAVRRVGLKGRMFHDEAAREQWRAGVGRLLKHINPYSGTRLSEDPAIAALLFFDEQDILLNEVETPAFAELWRKWLTAKYGSAEKLATAWTDASGKRWLPDGETPGSASLKYGLFWEGSPRTSDLGYFLSDTLGGMNAWYQREVAALGYKGLVTQWDCSTEVFFDAVRAPLPVVSMSRYFARPTAGVVRGSSVRRGSSTSMAGDYFREMAATRFSGRPFFIVEYQHCFWNAHRHEQGALMGAYAAFQDMDGLMACSSPVATISITPIKPCSISSDPIARASEVVAAYLFLRDASPSARLVELSIDAASVIAKGQAWRDLPQSYAMLSLLTRIGIDVKGAPAPSGVPPVPTPSLKFEIGDLSSAPPLTELATELQAAGILATETAEKTAKGIFESDTGQLLMDTRAGVVKVITPCAEVVSIAKPYELSLGAVKLVRSSTPASVAVIAVDKASSLKMSRRLLVVYSTDALNTGMVFDNADKSTLRELGTQPVLMRSGSLSLSVESAHASKLRAWSVGMNGARLQEIPLKKRKGIVTFSVDTRSLAAGPTPFFEISADR